MKSQLYYSPYTYCLKCNVCGYKLDWDDEITNFMETRPSYSNNDVIIAQSLLQALGTRYIQSKESDEVKKEREEKKQLFIKERNIRTKYIMNVNNNAIKLFREHVLVNHSELCHSCETCDKKFIRIKDAIKKRHKCSYKKTKLKKKLLPFFYKDIGSVILDYLE